MLREIEEIIAIDSSGARGTVAISDYFSPLLEETGFTVDFQRVILDETEQVNLLAWRGNVSEDDEGLILHTHLDTVPPGPSELWTATDGNPFRAVIQGDKVFGLGVADVKLDFLCKVRAASHYRGKKLRKPLILVGSFGEEMGLLGTKYLLNRCHHLKGPFVLVGEPTDLALATAHKGYKVLQLNISKTEKPTEIPSQCRGDLEDSLMEVGFLGQEAHSSTPQLGNNAIEGALGFLSAFPEVCKGLLAIRGGRQHNIIPGSCKLLFSSAQSEQLKELCRSRGISWRKITGSAAGRLEKNPNSNDLLGILMLLHREWKKLQEAMAGQQDPLFTPPYSTSNMGKISSSRQSLQVVLDLRFLPHQDVSLFEGKIRNICQEVEQTYPYFKSKVEVLHENPPYRLPADSRLLKASCRILERINGEAKVLYKSTSTEAGVYAKYGFEPLIFGPGPSVGNVHAPNEYNLISHLHKAVAFYEEVIAQFCL